MSKEEESVAVKEPLDLVTFILDKCIYVKLHSDWELRGKLQAYGQHLNMILGDVDEITTTMEIDDETYVKIVRTTKPMVPFLLVRGGGVMLVSPPERTTYVIMRALVQVTRSLNCLVMSCLPKVK